MRQRRLSLASVRTCALGAALVLSVLAVVNEARDTSLDFATRYAAGVTTSEGHDPYDFEVLAPVEERLVGHEFDYPFRDPPPVAYAYAAVSIVPLAPAAVLWLVVSIGAALVCVLLAARLAGLPGGRNTWLWVGVIALNFAPFRNGLALEQIDPFVAALTLIGFAAARSPGGGLLQAIAVLKPQTTLLATAGGIVRGRTRFAVSLLAGSALLVGASAVASALRGGPTWGGWLATVQGAGSGTTPWYVAAFIGALALVVVFARRAWRSLQSEGLDRSVATFIVAICVNGVLLSFVFLNLHSLALILVPLAVAALRAGSTMVDEALLGVVAGVFFVDGLFAVSYYSGIAHAVLPLAVAALIALAAASAFPARRGAVVIALATNIALTVPPFRPEAHRWWAAAAALLLLVHLGRAARPKGDVPGGVLAQPG